MGSTDFVVRFPEGLPGIDAGQVFQLSAIEPGGPFYELKSLQNESVTLVLTDPIPFFPDYQIHLSVGELGSIELSDEKNSVIFVVTVVSDDISKISVNLLAPVIINKQKGLGKQVILSDTRFGVRHPLFNGIANGQGEVSC